MSHIVDDPTARIGARIRLEREGRGWSLSELADRSGVSRAMINKVERGESSPTATLLGRLSGAFALTISQLISRAEPQAGRVSRADDQPRWTDPATGYVRRQVSPRAGGPTELTEVELPPGVEVAYPAAAYAFSRRLIWVMAGVLTYIEGEAVHVLEAGDCLELGEPVDGAYRNDGPNPARYAVVVLTPER
ncbi:helix-turn-helix domain-containing protein [Rhodococcus daqingensis]|uniref:Helix-turn-helix domain-containing protein n=1 Tax=Rhodococcus daqingensis TaxID=2479363 RepID=A0ABW2RY32_9NOCA